ncbi:histidine phosphatase family protein [Amycolatopsis suaedae]|uniref:Histidine phosphatase family protein n=1 Tax=Amycolatopsis suaedae TaxID=2510978 RepID=A0A4Q7J1H2_9PSEU|nr:histidine phosphatase family protein [Amycolatopsis suaedae]RZQ61240.1 histidine phosphatase family protein [Amycolatopsis suaedae]
MRTLHVVTHPEATHHVDGLVGGWYDSALTPAGHRAAAAVARSLRARIAEGADVELFTSDLLRTAQTAAAVAELFGIEPVADSRLREKSFGEAEGRPKAWLDERYVRPAPGRDRMGHDGVPGVESVAALAKRIYAAMDDILARPCENQIVVTHGFALTYVVAHWIGMPVESTGVVAFPVASGSITVLRADDRFGGRALACLGETGHLDGR